MAEQKITCKVCGGTIWVDDAGKVHREFSPNMSPFGTNWVVHLCPVQQKPSDSGLRLLGLFRRKGG